MYELKKLQDAMSKAVFGKTKDQAVKEGLCIECGEPALPNCYSEAGKKEFYISGLCEKCFDRIAGG